MAGAIINIEINGVNELNIKLRGSVDRARNLTVPMKRGAAIMMASTEQNFSIGGRPVRWVSLKISTLKEKMRKGYSSQPLIRSGFLKASIIPKIESMGFKIGTSVKYARIHQKGGFAGRNKSAYIPSRPYLVFQKTDIQEINETVKGYIINGV